MASVGKCGDADVLPAGGTAAVGAEGSGNCLEAPAAEAMTGTRVFPDVSSKGVVEAPTSSAGAASAAVPAAAPATDGTVFSTASGGGGGQGARFCRWNSGIDGGTGDQRYCSLGCTN